MEPTLLLLISLAFSFALLAGCAIVPPATSPLPSPTTSPPATTPAPGPTPAPTPSGTTTTPAPMPAPANTITLTPAEVAKHSTPDDCWMIIDGTVYDLSGFAPQHSGGSVAIAAFCGQDGSQAFDTRGGTGSHRSRDRELLATAALGAVGATIAG